MDLKIIKNTPYVLLLLVVSFLFNAVLSIPTPWTMSITWILEYYIVFWMYQNYAYKAPQLLWLDIFRRKALLGGAIYLGALIGHHIYYGTVTAIVSIAYAVMVIVTFALLEYSLYN
jgi:hypothetical protein